MLNTAALRRFIRRYPRLRGGLAFAVRVARLLVGIISLPPDAIKCFGMWQMSRRPGIGSSASGRTIVMIVVSDLRFDPRVEREARALAGAGYVVVVIWPDTRDPNKPEPELDWGPGILFNNLPLRAGGFAYRLPGFLGHEMAQVALKYRPLAFHAHDLTTALVGLIAARGTGAHLVCDFHEWYSENVTWNVRKKAYEPHPWYVRVAFRSLERLVFKYASAAITVCNSLAREMERECGAKPNSVHVIRNIPDLAVKPTRDYRPLKVELGIPDDRFLLLYQGGVGPSRMIEPIIEALPMVAACTLVIRGPGIELYGDGYIKLARELHVEDRVFVLPSVPSRDVVVAARGADAGIYTVLDVCKNFKYALPNKVFEYLAADLPVLSAFFSEPKSIIDRYGVGATFDPRDPQSIAGAIRLLVSDRGVARDMAARTAEALRNMNADAEWDKLVAIYRNLEAASAAERAHA